jgi:hypothetical protein
MILVRRRKDDVVRNTLLSLICIFLIVSTAEARTHSCKQKSKGLHKRVCPARPQQVLAIEKTVLAPPAISPNGDGVLDTTSWQVDLRIYPKRGLPGQLKGLLLKALRREFVIRYVVEATGGAEPITVGTGEVPVDLSKGRCRQPIDINVAGSWDGRNEGGTVLADGDYSLELKAQLLRVHRKRHKHKFWRCFTKTIATVAGSLGTVTIDTVPVSVASSPANGHTIIDVSPTVTIDYEDSGSGIDISTLLVRIDGVERTGECTIGNDSASLALSNLAAGPHSIGVELQDNAGNKSEYFAALSSIPMIIQRSAC